MKIQLFVPGRFHAFNLAQQLLKRGFLMCLVTSYPKFKIKQFGIPGTKVVAIFSKEILERGWRRLPKFLRKAYNPQVLISAVFSFWAARLVEKSDIFVGWSGFSLLALRKAKKMGAVGIIERGSSHIEFQKNILEEEYAKWGMKVEPFMVPHPKMVDTELKEYEEADYISIPSLYVKRTFLEKGVPESKLIHVPYGVDLSSFRQVPKEDKKFRVVFAGGMTLRKGVHYLLRAFAELNLPNAELLLIGSMNEEMKPFFKKYEGNFKWVGHVPQAKLYKYYSQGSVFVLMSIEEGLAMVQPQAMACGMPVICTTNTGGEDIIRDGQDGFVIPIRAVDILKEKLIYLYENSEVRAQMGRSAKERVSSGFTWDDYGRKIISEYERVLAKKS